MVNGVVGSNTHRKLDPQEFRGFSLVDERAPLVFVNGADTKAAQIFTLAHELAHLWVGQSGVSDVAPQTIPTGEVEAWCNRVAAEFLVPAYDLQDAAVDRDDLVDALQSLARRFKVSTLVALRRIFDVGLITATEFHVAYEDELGRVMSLVRADSESGGGGNFYNTQPLRVSRRFARAIVESTLEGHTLYRDAFQMLGFKKQSTFDEMAERLGVGR